MEQNGISMDIHYQSLQWLWNVTHFDSGGYGCQRSKCLFSLRSSNDVIDTWAFADDSDVEHITYPIGHRIHVYMVTFGGILMGSMLPYIPDMDPMGYIDLIIRYHVVYPSGLAETASQPAPLICCGKENTNIQQLWQIVWALQVWNGGYRQDT